MTSTYANSQKYRVKIEDPASGITIFENAERKRKFLQDTKMDISTKLGISSDFVKIVNLEKGSIILGVVIDMNPDQRYIGNKYAEEALPTDISKKKVKDVLETLYGKTNNKVNSEDIFNIFTFDANYMDSDFDREYTKRDPIKDSRGKYPYYLPIGYRRLGIKVMDLYNNDNT